jgi:hypothetical protein
MRNTPISGVILVAATALVVLSVARDPARAQDRMTHSPSAVQECLCAERAVSLLRHEVQRERQQYDQARETANRLARRVEEARRRVNVTDRGDITAFKALLERRDAAHQAYLDESLRYDAVVARYNRAVNHNNNVCTGRLFDPEEVESIKQTLVCPGP